MPGRPLASCLVLLSAALLGVFTVTGCGKDAKAEIERISRELETGKLKEQAAIDAFVALGDTSIPKMVEAIIDGIGGKTYWVMSLALRQMNGKLVGAEFMKRYREEEDEGDKASIGSLMGLIAGDSGDVQVYIDMSRSKYSSVRQGSTAGLGAWMKKDTMAKAELRRLLSDSAEGVRTFAAMQLAQVLDPLAENTLIELANSPTSQTRIEAAASLTIYPGARATKALELLRKDSNQKVRSMAETSLKVQRRLSEMNKRLRN